MPTLAESLAVLADTEDANDVAAQLRTAAPKVYQIAFDAGHSTATAQSKKDIKALETKLADAETARSAAEDKLTEATRSQPDVAKLRADHEAVILDLKERHKAELKALKDAAKDRERSAALKSLELALVAAGVDPDYAEVQVQKESIRNRIDVADDGTVTFRQLDKDTPYSGKDATENTKLLAADIRKSISNPKFLAAAGDAGSGTTGAAEGVAGDAALFERMRRKGRELSGLPPAPTPANAPAPTPAAPTPKPLEERLGMRRL